MLYVAPFSGERPAPADKIELGPDDPWTDVDALGKLAMVAQQDTFNMERVQQGMKVLRRDGLVLSRYQEALIRWRHDLIEEYVEKGPRW